MPRPHGTVGSKLKMTKAAVIANRSVVPAILGGGLTRCRQGVFDKTTERIKERLEVGFANQGSLVTVLLEQLRDRRSIDGQGNSVHPNAMRAWILTGNHG